MASDFSGSHAATSESPILTSPADYEMSGIHRARRAMGIAFFLCAALMLTLTGCDSEAMLTADSSDRDTALRILQTDSRMLAFADVETQMDASMRMMGDDADYQAMVEEGLQQVYEMTGVRVDEDVHSVFVAIDDFSDDANGGVVAFVDFDQDEVASQAASIDEVERIDSDWPVDAFVIDGKNEEAAVAFAEGSLVLLATDVDHLRRMLDRAYGDSGPVSLDPMLAEVADRESWMIVRGLDDYTENMSMGDVPADLAMMQPLLSSLENMAVGFDQDGDSMSAEVLIQPNASVSVDDYANLLTGIRAMMRLQFRDLDVASEMVDRIDIEADGEWVSLEMEIDREDMERLEEELREEMGGRFN